MPDDVTQLTAFRSHHTATSTSGWDGPANERRVRTGEADGYYGRVYAWSDPSGTAGTKAAYRFVHHHVNGGGDPGPANVRACITGIAVLNGGRGGTTIPDADRKAVWAHLAAHLRDANAEPPELKAAADAEQTTGIVFTVDIDGEQWTVDADGDWQLATVDDTDTDDLDEDPDDDDEDDEDGVEAAGDLEQAKGKPPWLDKKNPTDGETPTDDKGKKKKKMPPWLEKKVKGADDGNVNAAAIQFEMSGTASRTIDLTVTDPADLVAGLVAWQGVLCVEGIATGDGRLFQQNSLWWDENLMPQDLFAMLRDPDGGEGHDGAEICGRIDRIWREPHPTSADMNLIMGSGVYDTQLPAGAQVARLQGQGMLTGVSVDVDSVQIEMSGDEPDLAELLGVGSGETRFAKGRIRRATVCSIPAFIEARIRPVDTLVAGAEPAEFPQTWTIDTPSTGWGQDNATLVASGFGDRSEVFTSPLVERPPAEVFERQSYDAYTPARIDADGRISGHVVPWGDCHIGFKDRCVLVTGSDNAYRYARTGHVLTAEGSLVPTARVYAQFRAGRRAHAPENLAAADAVAWYEEMSLAVADVVIYDDMLGMQIQGRVRPGITQHQLIALRASDLSPDWRAIRGKRECLAIAAVNVSGFPSRYDRLPALVASAVEQGLDIDLVTILARQLEGSAWVDDGRVVTLVASAANVNRPERSLTQALADTVAQLAADVGELKAERYADKAAQVLAGLDFTPDEDQLAATTATPDGDPDDGPDGEDEEVPEEELAAWAAAALDGLDQPDEELHGAHHHDQADHNTADPAKKKTAKVKVKAKGKESAAGTCDGAGCTSCESCRAAAAAMVD